MRKTLAAVTMLAAILLGAAAPASAATSGTQRFIINGNDNDQFLFGAGVITGVGIDQTIDDDNDVFIFPNGSFHVFHPQTSDDGNFNDVACVGTDSFEGTFTISGGTGAYAGISGSGTYSGRAVFFTTRTDTGCSENDADGSSVFFVNATGTINLP